MAFLRFFDIAKMTGGQQKLSVALYEGVHAAYTDPLFVWRVRIVASVSHSVGHWSRWLEGCWCHESLLLGCRNFAERKQALQEAGIEKGH